MKPGTSTIVAITVISAWSRLAAGTGDGSCLEPFELRNFQPKSATQDQLVRSSAYRDLPAVVMLLSAG